MPARRLRATQRQGLRLHRQHQAEQRADDDQRQRARGPMGGAFDEHDEFERQAGVDQHVERAVVGVGLEQPVEAEQRRQQRGDPQDRRPEARQQIEVRPEREGHDRNQDEKEHRADRGAAADAAGDAPFPGEERARRPAHAAILAPSPSARFAAPSSPSGAWVAARMSPPAARCSPMTAANRPCAATSSAVVGSSSSQIGRARDEKARQRDAALLARRERAHGKIGDVGEAEARQSAAPSPARRIAAERRRPERQVLARRQRALQRIGVAEIMRLLADARLARPAFEDEGAGGERQEAGDGAQEARLARPVRPGQHERRAGARLEGKA